MCGAVTLYRKRYENDTFMTSKYRGLFFILKKGDENMDVNKLFHKVIEDEEIKGIPLLYVFAVINSVIEAINSGECFYQTEHE